MSSRFYVDTLPVLPLCMDYPEETWTWFDILIYASTTQKTVCSFELSLFSCIPAFIYQLIVKSVRAFVHWCLLLLWSVKPFYSRMTRRNKLQYLIHIQDWVKTIVLRRSKCQPSFCSVLPWSITHFMSGMSWGLHLLLWILDIVILLAIIVHSLVPCCHNRSADEWIVMREIYTPSNSIAW